MTELQFVFARITRFGPILKKSIDLVENSEKPPFGPILKNQLN